MACFFTLYFERFFLACNKSIIFGGHVYAIKLLFIAVTASIRDFTANQSFLKHFSTNLHIEIIVISREFFKNTTVRND